MIFWKIFYTFCKIGIVNFGGGYAMLSLIYGEVVEQQGWLSAQEFTDIVAVSQGTPGPIGINVATYCGYTAVRNEGYSTGIAVLGAVLASFAVILLPVLLMILVCSVLRKFKENPWVKSIFDVLRPTVVGLIAAAAILLLTPETFGTEPVQVIASIAIFAGVFIAAFKFKKNPVLLLLISAIVGLIIYL